MAPIGTTIVLWQLFFQQPNVEDALTPWERRTWSAPPLELVPPATPTRPRILAPACLRAYVLVIAAALMLKLLGLLPL